MQKFILKLLWKEFFMHKTKQSKALLGFCILFLLFAIMFIYIFFVSLYTPVLLFFFLQTENPREVVELYFPVYGAVFQYKVHLGV